MWEETAVARTVAAILTSSGHERQVYTLTGPSTVTAADCAALAAKISVKPIVTEANSWKVKRICNNSRVRLAPSDASGNPEGEWVEALATIADLPAEIKATEKRLAKKYASCFMFIR